MNCLECQELLQQRLDGAVSLSTVALEQHLAECVECRELFAAARRLNDGLATLPRPLPAEGLATRIVAAALADRSRRRQRARLRGYVTFALAASVLILMLAGHFLPTPQDGGTDLAKSDPPRPKVTPPQPTPPPPPALAKSADEARQAVAQLTERVADQTREQAKILLAMANPLERAPLQVPSMNEAPLEPATKSIREAGERVADGIEPVARTARRAWNYFVKELPVYDINPTN